MEKNPSSLPKIYIVTAQNIQSNETFLTLKVSQYFKSGSTAALFPKLAGRDLHRLPPVVLVLAGPSRPSCAGARLQELGH